MLAKDTPVDRADVHGDIERARAICHVCSCTCPPGRRQEKRISERLRSVLYRCDEAEKNSEDWRTGGGSERGTNNLTLEYQ